ncbi:MAG: FlgD immunoglobulin-like domain containing protein [Candidatus Eisenbacteria bacterium]
MKIRFIAQDTGGGSVVEAAVDDIEITLPPPAVSVDPGLPSSARLLLASPNPLQQSSVLRFALDARQRVALDIVDVQGRAIRSLANGVMEPGEHALVWDGRDAAGRELPQGVYLERLSTESTRESQKLLIVR